MKNLFFRVGIAILSMGARVVPLCLAVEFLSSLKESSSCIDVRKSLAVCMKLLFCWAVRFIGYHCLSRRLSCGSGRRVGSLPFVRDYLLMKVKCVYLLWLVICALSACGGTEKELEIADLPFMHLKILQAAEDTTDNVFFGFAGRLESDEVAILGFTVPLPLVKEGYENNGAWRSYPFVSYLRIQDGQASAYFQASSDLKFKVLVMNSDRLVVAFSGRYLNPINGRYITVLPTQATLFGDALKKALKDATLQAP